MRDSMQQAATEMESSVSSELQKTETELNQAAQSMREDKPAQKPAEQPEAAPKA